MSESVTTVLKDTEKEHLKTEVRTTLTNLANFDVSDSRYSDLSRHYQSDERPVDISVDRKGEWLENGRFKVEEGYNVEYFDGGELGERTAFEIGLKNEVFSFMLASNHFEPSTDMSQLHVLENVRTNVLYRFELDTLTSEQLHSLIDFAKSPIAEIDKLMAMVDTHTSTFEQTKSHDLTQWLANYNRLTSQEQQYIIKKMDYANHVSLETFLIGSSPEIVTLREDLDQSLGELASELEMLHDQSEDLYALESELSMTPETIVKDVHELLATDQYKQRVATFKEVETILFPEKAFSRDYGIEHDRAFSSDDLVSLYEKSSTLSRNEVYAAINLHQSEAIVEWSYSGNLSVMEVEEYQANRTENLRGNVLSGHSAYQINTDTELLLVPNKQGQGHDGFILTKSGDMTSLKTESTEATLDKLIELDAYSVPSLPSLKSLLAAPEIPANTKQPHVQKMAEQENTGRDYR